MTEATATMVAAGLRTLRHVDALFSLPKHFSAANIHTAAVSTGVSLEYAIHTKAVPDATEDVHVLLVMGYMEYKEAWAPVVDLMLEKWGTERRNLTLVTFDNRGSGGSTTGWMKYSTSTMAKDGLALMDHLGWDRAHVVGVSMGGMVSLELASAAPERVQSLTLMVTTRGRFESGGANSAILKIMVSSDPTVIASSSLSMLYPPEYLASGRLDDKTSVSDVLRRFHINKAKTIRPQALSGLVGQAIAIRTHFVSDERLVQLRDAGFPILIIGSKKDTLIPGVESVKLKNIMDADHVRLVYHENVGHGGFMQCPEENADEILATIRSAH